MELAIDDRYSYGPETITIDYKYAADGTYRYYVRDYTNRDEPSSIALANSGAQVVVYRSNKQVAFFKVPRKAGTIWHVFNIVKGKIRKVNKMYSSYSVIS